MIREHQILDTRIKASNVDGPRYQIPSVRRHVLESQTPQFYFAPGDTNVFTGPCCWLYFLEGG